MYLPIDLPAVRISFQIYVFSFRPTGSCWLIPTQASPICLAHRIPPSKVSRNALVEMFSPRDAIDNFINDFFLPLALYKLLNKLCNGELTINSRRRWINCHLSTRPISRENYALSFDETQCLACRIRARYVFPVFSCATPRRKIPFQRCLPSIFLSLSSLLSLVDISFDRNFHPRRRLFFFDAAFGFSFFFLFVSPFDFRNHSSTNSLFLFFTIFSFSLRFLPLYFSMFRREIPIDSSPTSFLFSFCFCSSLFVSYSLIILFGK